MRPPGSPRTGVPGRLHREAAGERPPRARPQRRGSPGPIPNPAVKPAFAESTAALGCGRAGRRARGGRFSIGAERGPRGRFPLRASSRLGGTPEGAFPRPGGSTEGYVSKSVSFGIIHCLYLVGIWNSSQTIPVPCSSGAPSSRFDSLDTAANSPSTSSSVGMTRRISAAGSGLSVCA